ncbi:uncharacterized protein PV07_00650 [Cladophialophora immunda]|uniref:Uncharacterized protein n=1 Tax=Cladophialophora immunda TaxID=569365 RepID=A0A0D2A066_9EURO|nr:uncharacterized protein PV07_00650 [Cladophialophora immunda]KIW33831.1 hypothetical protein PV07_00650 [Cladophialophora immunda]
MPWSPSSRNTSEREGTDLLSKPCETQGSRGKKAQVTQSCPKISHTTPPNHSRDTSFQYHQYSAGFLSPYPLLKIHPLHFSTLKPLLILPKVLPSTPYSDNPSQAYTSRL